MEDDKEKETIKNKKKAQNNFAYSQDGHLLRLVSLLGTDQTMKNLCKRRVYGL